MNRKERRENEKEISILDEVVNIIKQYFPELMKEFDKLANLLEQ